MLFCSGDYFCYTVAEVLFTAGIGFFAVVCAKHNYEIIERIVDFKAYRQIIYTASAVTLVVIYSRSAYKSVLDYSVFIAQIFLKNSRVALEEAISLCFIGDKTVGVGITVA